MARVFFDAIKTGSYILISFPLAIGYIVFFATGLGTGFGLIVVLVGFVILAFVLFAAALAMRLERWLAIHLLSAQIPPLNLRKARPERERVRVGHKGRTRTIVSTLRDYLTSASLWKGLVLLVIKLPLIIVV
ncbi:MAG TPA: sensor domain-containing protein, partial [Gaiellaceae bacterium]